MEKKVKLNISWKNLEFSGGKFLEHKNMTEIEAEL